MGIFIVDGHQDVAMTLLLDEGRDYGAPAPNGRGLSLPDARRGHLGLILATIFAPEGAWGGRRPMSAAREQLRLYEELLDRHAEHLFRVESRGDLELCRAGGPIGVVHLVEGADPIASPDALPWWVDQGVRVIGLAWNTKSRYCGGTNDDTGLTDAGRELLDAMHEHQLVCDVSHLNHRAVEDVLLSADGPIVASHSNAYAVHAHRRNLRDEHVRAIADRGGLVGVTLYGPFLGKGKTAIDDIVAHIDHLIEVAGPEHVGIGSDIDGGFTTDDVPAGIATVADLPRIGEALRDRGYTQAHVGAILGENWMRILRESLPRVILYRARWLPVLLVALMSAACGGELPTPPPHGLEIETLEDAPHGDPIETYGDVRPEHLKAVITESWTERVGEKERTGRAVFHLDIETRRDGDGLRTYTRIVVAEAEGLARSYVSGFSGLEVSIGHADSGRPDPDTLRFETQAPPEARTFLRGFWLGGLAGATPWFPDGPLAVGAAWPRTDLGPLRRPDALDGAVEAKLEARGGGRLKGLVVENGGPCLQIRLETLVELEAASRRGGTGEAVSLGIRDRGEATFRIRDGMPVRWTLVEETRLGHVVGEDAKSQIVTVRVQGTVTDAETNER